MSTDFKTWEANLSLARSLVERLSSRRLRIVLAESCTAGLAAATIGTVPGVSSWLCGSAVTYRESVKSDWLGLDPETLHAETAVSQYASSEMARGVLSVTREADVSAAITGHLGPDAPPSLDGVCYVAIAHRGRSGGSPSSRAERSVDVELLTECRIQLAERKRLARQQEAVSRLLEMIIEALRSLAPTIREGDQNQ